MARDTNDGINDAVDAGRRRDTADVQLGRLVAR